MRVYACDVVCGVHLLKCHFHELIFTVMLKGLAVSSFLKGKKSVCVNNAPVFHPKVDCFPPFSCMCSKIQ